MIALICLLLLSGGVIAALAVEAARHKRRLARVPIRIHVAGTRGKSSVSRMIACGLRASGLSCAAKTTGSAARYIDPIGREWPLPRPLGPSIGEQVDVLAMAERHEAKALVVECMALLPAYHWVLEDKLIRATHAVITNIRADHLDVMGPRVADAARAIASMIPQNGVLYTTERAQLELLRRVANARNTRLVEVGPERVAAIDETALARFSYLEHAENVALALRVLEDFGVPEERAMAAFAAIRPDPGAACEIRLGDELRGATFVNAFAANDPLSTEHLWRRAGERHPAAARRIALFALRGEREERSRQFAKEARFWHDADCAWVWGAGAEGFARLAVAGGYPAARLRLLPKAEPQAVATRVCAFEEGQSLVVGMGNIAGNGLLLVNELRARGRA